MRIFSIALAALGIYFFSQGYISGELLHHIESFLAQFNDSFGGH